MGKGLQETLALWSPTLWVASPYSSLSFTFLVYEPEDGKGTQMLKACNCSSPGLAKGPCPASRFLLLHQRDTGLGVWQPSSHKLVEQEEGCSGVRTQDCEKRVGKGVAAAPGQSSSSSGPGGLGGGAPQAVASGTGVSWFGPLQDRHPGK